jgi:NAD(P)-dependent dehydrogenase (short-subunit alcohol dehydrogenase family)
MTSAEVRFDGRAILVTGAGRGLGRAHARLLASRGAKVVVADNGAAMDGEDPSAGPAQAVVAEIAAGGGEAVACTVDIATEDGSAAAVEACLNAYGRIDGLLHNASTVPDNAPIERLSTHDLDVVMRVNAYAALWMTRAAWPHMTAQGYGRILYMTSAGIYGSEGNAPYAAAKAAVVGVMRCLALEGVKHGVFVNLVAPAALTRMTERLPASDYAAWFARTMAPEKVSAGVAYLLSEDCRIYGEMLHMGGGRVARMTLAESDGVLLAGDAIEDVRAVLPQVLAQTDFFHPKDLGERSLAVAQRLGYRGGVGADTYTIKPIGKT